MSSSIFAVAIGSRAEDGSSINKIRAAHPGAPPGPALRLLLEEAGADPAATWFLAEGADAAAMSRFPRRTTSWII
jgi:hypothetical protein